MKKNEISLIDAFRTFVNSNIGLFIYRKNIIRYIANLGNAYFADSYVDGTRRMLVVCGYLEYTGAPGVYKCIKLIPSSLTYNKLRNDYDELILEHKDKFIGNSKCITDKYIK